MEQKTRRTQGRRAAVEAGNWQGMAAVAGPHCELPGVPLASSSGLAYEAVKMKLACRLAAPQHAGAPGQRLADLRSSPVRAVQCQISATAREPYFAG